MTTTALDEMWPNVAISRSTVGDLPLTSQVWDKDVKPLVAKIMWSWWGMHQNVKILQHRVLFLKVTITVRDLKPVFFRLFGPDPFAE